MSIPSVTRATLYVLSARARLQVFVIPEKAASGKRLDAVLGQIYLHSWCLIVVRHGGKARSLRRVVADLQPLFHKRFFQGLTDWDLLFFFFFDPLCHFTFSLEVSSAGVAQLPPSYHKLLNEKVTTFAVFPSWMYPLESEDNCMLSVISSTSDLHLSCWQSCTNFPLWFSSKGECSPFCSVLLSCTRGCLLDDSRLYGLTLRPSAPVCCCRRDSLARGRLAFAQEAVRGPPSLFDSAGCARWFQADSEKCLFMRC